MTNTPTDSLTCCFDTISVLPRSLCAVSSEGLSYSDMPFPHMHYHIHQRADCCAAFNSTCTTILTFPLCCFDQIVCWCPRDTPCKCININGFRTCYSQLLSLVEPRTRAHPLGAGVQAPPQCPERGRSPELSFCTCLRTTRFHGVSSENRRLYLLKSRYGKASILTASAGNSGGPVSGSLTGH
jgi:hypothetical protein